MKNSKGFTLIELLAVIAILALLVLISVPMITRYVRDARQFSNESILSAAEDAAINYGMENQRGSMFIKDSCAKTTPISSIVNDNCIKKVTINTLITEGYLKDSASKLNKNKEVIVYKYINNGKYELKAYADKSLLS